TGARFEIAMLTWKPTIKLPALVVLPWAVAALAAGCNPYNPELGDQPFQCGTVDPTCPEGYRCVERSEEVRVCVQDGLPDPPPIDAAPVEIDAPTFLCANDDSLLGPNNDINNPTGTPIPDLVDEYELVGLGICPNTNDVDVFQFRLDGIKNIQVDIEFLAERGTLALDILNSSGVPLAQGVPVGGDQSRLRATVASANAGFHYARVQAATLGVVNNYQISIVTSVP
ncbi:MAG: hypothetical protein AAGC55_14235, partial [Myxococcota bacterium]